MQRIVLTLPQKHTIPPGHVSIPMRYARMMRQRAEALKRPSMLFRREGSAMAV
jgi:hypothetical protein